jgi:hypothetical protein
MRRFVERWTPRTRPLRRQEETVRFIALSTHGDTDIVFYPDSNKLGAAERLRQGGVLRTCLKPDDQVDYCDGEVPPPS